MTLAGRTTRAVPRTSVVVLAYRRTDLLDRCLRALEHHRSRDPFEVIVVSNGVAPEVSDVLRRHRWSSQITSRANLGFAAACNLGVAASSTELIVLLNDDAVVEPGWLDALVDVVDQRPRAGAVGSLILDAEGAVLEAGSVIWREGSTSPIGRGEAVDSGLVSCLRRVDYASACSLLVRRQAWDEAGGMDPGYFPAYYEDVDLSLRLLEQGWHTWYTPASRVRHAESASSSPATKPHLMRRGETRFIERWAHQLDRYLSHSGGAPAAVAAAARTAIGGTRRVLVIDDVAPAIGMGSGYDRMRRVLDGLIARGTRVTFLPTAQPHPGELGSIGVEVTHDLDEFLGGHPAIDAAIISRPHNFRFAAALRAAQPHIGIVYDAEALFSRRLERLIPFVAPARRPAISDEAETMLRVERSIATSADLIVTISPDERDWFAAAGGHSRVVLLPPVPSEVRMGAQPFADRRGALFVSGWQAGPEGPNVDALCWFVREILPLVKRQIPWFTLGVTGGDPPEQVTRLASPSVRFLGQVEDLDGAYDGVRVAISPIRWGAGVKLKTMSALAAGVPVVSTSIGAEGLPEVWAAAVEIADQPADFAAAVVRLVSDPTAWESSRQHLARAHDLDRVDPTAAWIDILDRVTSEVRHA